MAIENLIPERIEANLTRFPPFSMLEKSEVAKLAQMVSVSVKVKDDTLWTQGDTPGQYLYFLARGRVEYLAGDNGKNELVDIRDVGDLLGLTAFYENKPFIITARVIEDSFFYAIPWSQMLSLIENNDDARNYVRRHLFWATRLGISVKLPERTDTIVGGRSKNILQAHLDGAHLIQPRRLDRLVTCSPKETIHEVASKMGKLNIPSMLVVDEDKHPIGIVTHSNLVSKVIVEKIDENLPIDTIMSQPVVTVKAYSSSTVALILMLRKRIGQVCVTEDGTPNSPALDIFSEKDLLTQSGLHPAGILREIRYTRAPGRFREICDDIERIIKGYLESGVSAIFVGQLCAELYDELIQRFLDMSVVELMDEGISIPASGWAWLSVGSDGRREQLLRTDMDNAIIFTTPDDDAETIENFRAKFTILGEYVINKMQNCGFAKCQGGVMALNPKWCRTLNEWETEIADTSKITDSDKLIRAIIMYDMRYVAGEQTICDQLKTKIYKNVAGNPQLQKRLAEIIIATPPPLNFFGRFVVEKKGGNEGKFDIKKRVLSPIRGAAQILALKYNLSAHHSTGGRWDEIHEKVEKHADLALMAKDSYDVLLKMRTINGLNKGNSGRYIEPSSLTKLQKAQLSNVFDVVRMVQTMIRLEFQLDMK